jgi:hypothetical protein
MIEALGIIIDDVLKENLIKGKIKPWEKIGCIYIT